MDQHVHICVVELTGCSEHAADVAIDFAFEMLGQHKCCKIELAMLGRCPTHVV